MGDLILLASRWFNLMVFQLCCLLLLILNREKAQLLGEIYKGYNINNKNVFCVL